MPPRSQRRLRILLGLALGVGLGSRTLTKAQDQSDQSGRLPDPVALLDGVAAARAAIPPSSLKLQVVWRDNVNGTQSQIWTVDFDQERRRWRRKVKGKTTTQAVYDGHRVLLYQPEFGDAEYRNVADMTNVPCFDPRVLGCVTVYDWELDASTFIYQGQRERFNSIETVEKVRNGENEAWHVSIVLDHPNGSRKFFSVKVEMLMPRAGLEASC